MSEFISGGEPVKRRNKLGTYLLQLRLKNNPQQTLGDMAKLLQVGVAELSGMEFIEREEQPTEAVFLALGIHYNKPHENAEDVARCLHKQDQLKIEMER